MIINSGANATVLIAIDITGTENGSISLSSTGVQTGLIKIIVIRSTDDPSLTTQLDKTTTTFLHPNINTITFQRPGSSASFVYMGLAKGWALLNSYDVVIA
jgi:hypothetical protein